MTPEQIQQFLANGGSAQQLAAIMSAPPAPAAFRANQDPMLTAILKAVDPKDRLQTLSHPKDAPWSAGGRGTFDGDYAVTVVSTAMDRTRAGVSIFKVILAIDESSNPAVTPGTQREHALFQSTDAAYSETKGLIQRMFAASGHVGAWDAEPDLKFYYGLVSNESQPAAGLRFRLSVSTESQRNNASKPFTHHRYGETCAVGQSLGITTSAAPVAAAPLAPATIPRGMVLPTASLPPSVPGGSAFPSAAPSWWPAGVPYTGS